MLPNDDKYQISCSECKFEKVTCHSSSKKLENTYLNSTLDNIR